MTIMEELVQLLQDMDMPVESGVFSKEPPAAYAVLTEMTEDFVGFADDQPRWDAREARITLFIKGNYRARRRQVVLALLDNEFQVTARQYIGRDDDTGVSQYSIDVFKLCRVNEN